MRASDWVLLPGWGFRPSVWDGVVRALRRLGHAACALPLPVAPTGGRALLDEATAAVGERIGAGPAWLVGWSLGALVVRTVAERLSERVAGLVVVADASGLLASGAEVARPLGAGLITDLTTDPSAVLDRYVDRVAAGSHDRDRAAHFLRAALLSGTGASPRALAAGLALLRKPLPTFHPTPWPVVAIDGEGDEVIPAGLRAARNDHVPVARRVTIPRAGHAPFVSRPRLFMARLLERVGS